MIKIGFHGIGFVLHARRNQGLQQLRHPGLHIVPKYARSCIDVMLLHKLPVCVAYVTHMHNRIAHIILTAVCKCTDSAAHSLVTHRMDMHGHAFFVCLAGNICRLLLGPVDESLMSVGIQRIHKSGAAFHGTVHEELDPVRYYVRTGILSGLISLGQSLVYIHPAFHFIA